MRQKRYRSWFVLAVVFAAGGLPRQVNGVELRPGDILVANRGAGKVVKVDPLSGARTVITSGPAGEFDPDSIAFGPNGELYVAAFRQRSETRTDIFRVDPATGSRTSVAGGLPLTILHGMAVEKSGTLLVSDTSTIFRVDPTTGSITPLSSGENFRQLLDLTLEPSGSIVVTDNLAEGGTLFRVDPVTGAQSVVSTGNLFRNPHGTFAGPDGVLWVIDQDAKAVFRVDPRTGDQQLVSTLQLFESGADITLDAAGRILVTEYTPQPGLIRVNPVTGESTLLSMGGELVSPFGVVVVPVPEPAAAIGLTGAAALLLARRRQ
jgi:streptogramin lyase